jgi:hypothetical protein
MRWFLRLTVAGAVVNAGSGCSNIHVKKVPVEKRIAGKDHHVKGFRYYVARPYIVVKKRLPVVKQTWQTKLVMVKYVGQTPIQPTPEYALLGLTPEPGHDGFGLYDLSGHPLEWSEWQVGPAVTSKQASAQPSGGQGGGAQTPVTTTPPAAGTAAPVSGTTTVITGVGRITTVTTTTGGAPGAGTPGTPAAPGSSAPVPPRVGAGRPGNAPADIGAPGDTSLSGVLPVPGVMAGGAPAGQTPAPAADPNPAKPADATPTDAIQVVNLPDFEEQFAIRNSNFAAEGKYDLHFTDGWSLDSMTGEWNATQVPVRILQSIQNAIGALSQFEQKSIPALRQAPAAPAPAAPKDKFAETPVPSEIRFEITREYAIEPGIYRVQKSWERLPAGPPDALSQEAAFGLLKDLGLPVVESNSVKKL